MVKPNKSLHWPPGVSVTLRAGCMIVVSHEVRQLLAPVS